MYAKMIMVAILLHVLVKMADMQEVLLISQ